MILTRDSLRIVDGLDSKQLKNIPKALPTLIMPFWDNADTARYTIPAWDGHACMFRLQGQIEDANRQQQYFVGVDQLPEKIGKQLWATSSPFRSIDWKRVVLRLQVRLFTECTAVQLKSRVHNCTLFVSANVDRNFERHSFWILSVSIS